jgi:hypothetical protein
MADSLGVTQVIRWTGYKPLKEAQLEVSKSQMLLLLLEFATINTKLFDYLASGNPVLAVVPEFAELSALLECYAASYYKVCDRDYHKIAEILKQCYNDFYQGISRANLAKTELFKEELNIEAETRDLVARFNTIYDFRIKDRR